MNLIFSLNNLNGRTDNFLGSPAGWEGQKVLEHRARISTHLANYSRGKGSNSKDGLSLSAELPTSQMQDVELLV